MPNLKSFVHRAPDAVRSASAELAERAASSHVSVSRQLAPVRTGFLRDNIYSERVNDQRWNVISGAPYSAFVEFDQPYFLHGYESAQRQLKEEAPQVLGVQLARVALGTR